MPSINLKKIDVLYYYVNVTYTSVTYDVLLYLQLIILLNCRNVVSCYLPHNNMTVSKQNYDLWHTSTGVDNIINRYYYYYECVFIGTCHGYCLPVQIVFTIAVVQPYRICNIQIEIIVIYRFCIMQNVRRITKFHRWE